ncbi:T9SS type A sorting domain-containing protein, partial [Runella sp.]|uniref:T9SS type A sorting domain-containing protein n=1 Tax=Runella sp. TaxID=1960881 RepID=UPI00301A7CC7
ALTFSVDGQATQSVVTLTLKATKGGKLSDMLSISSRITKAEAYGISNIEQGISNHERLGIALRFNKGGVQTISGLGFELYQNQPNPFVDKTSIGFHLPTPTTATLTIYDETGRLIHTQKGDFAKGYNSFTIEKALLNTTGMLYYKVETATDSGVKQMIQAK